MKKLLGAILLSATGSAMAQSSVTLYGLIDAGVTYVNNQGGHPLYEFQDGANFGNRWGLRGTEELGAGYKALFVLENSFSLGTGAFRSGGAEFGRTASVGIATPYGTLTGGRQYDFIYDYINQYNMNGYASVYAGHMGDFDRISGHQINNSLKYKSANYRGLTFAAMYGFSNVAGNFKDGSAWSGAVSFKNAGFSASAVYLRLYDVQIDPYAQIGTFNFLGKTVATRNANGTVTDLDSSTYFLVNRQSEVALGTSYNTGKLTVAANFTSTGMTADSGSATMNVYEAGAMYMFQPDVAILGGYQYTTFAGAHWHQPTLGAQYYLSKRTSFYINVSYLRASEGINANQGAGFYSQPSDSRTQVTSRIAMVHRF